MIVALPCVVQHAVDFALVRVQLFFRSVICTTNFGDNVGVDRYDSTKLMKQMPTKMRKNYEMNVLSKCNEMKCLSNTDFDVFS